MSEPERQSKRQRVSQACDYCRKRKSKCDGAQPVCSVCRLFKKPCTYGNLKKRGLQSGYVRGLESLLGLFIEHVSGGEMTIRTLFRSDYADAGFVDGEFLDRTTDRWRGSELAKDLELLLASDDNDSGQTVSRGNKLPPLEGEQVQIQQEHIQQEHIQQEHIQQEHIQQEHIQQEHIQQEPVIHSGDSGELQTSVAPLSFNFPDDTSALVDFYFQTTHCWFPVVERRDILQTLYDDGDDTPDTCREGHQLCLWSIIAYTSKALEDNSLGASVPSPDRIHAQICSSLMSDSTIDLGHVQAVLILALYEIGRGAFESAWVLMSQAHRMRIIVDGQGFRTGWTGRTQHVARGCSYLDTIISALLDQKPVFPPCKYGALAELDENGLEEWESWASPSKSTTVTARRPLRVLSTFNQITRLMQKLSNVLNDSEASSPEDVARDLQIWRSNLKKQHQINDSTLTPPMLTLHLTWDFVLLTSFHRARAIEPGWIPLVKGIVDSTLSKLVQYLEMTGISGSSPLLRAFAMQAERCLHKIHPMTDGNALSVQVRLGEILQKLDNHLGRRKHTQTENLEPLGQFEQGTVLPSQLIAGPEMRIQNESSTHSTSLPHPTHAGLQVPHSQSIHDAGAIPSLPQTDYPPSEINEFDDVFDDMLTFAQTRRHSEDATAFAQNLGFLASDFDFTSLTFQPTKTNPLTHLP